MRIPEGRVRKKQSLLAARPLGEFLGSELEQKLARALGRHLFAIVGWSSRGLQRRRNLVPLGLGISIHDHIREEGKQTRGAVAAGFEIKERRRGVDERGRCRARLERLVLNDIFQKRNVRLHPANAEFAQRAEHALESHRECLPGGRDFCEKRVVEGCDDATRRAHAGVEANSESGRAAVGDDFAVIRREFIRRILGGHAALDGIAVTGNVRLQRQCQLGAVQRGSGRDEDLRAHEIDAGDLLGHRVLDLDAGVHLNEEPLFFIYIVEKLDRAGIVVANALSQAHSGIAEVAPNALVESHGGRDLDNLLVAPLHRAVALVQMQHISVAIAQNLHLNMLRPWNVFFEEDSGISKRPPGLALGFIQQVDQIFATRHHPHPTPATAKGRFDDQWKTHPLRDTQCLGAVAHRIFRARQRRHIQLLRQCPRGGLIAHRVEQLRVRSHKSDPRLHAGPRKSCIFR